jgi:hypothetical protein
MKTKLFLLTVFFILLHFRLQAQFFNAVWHDDVKIVEKNKSIAIWRIIIIDKTNYFSNTHQEDIKNKDYKNLIEKKTKYNIESTNKNYFPYFEILKRTNDNKLIEPTVNPNNFRYRYAYKEPRWSWSEKDSASVLDELIITTARPGNYYMDRIKFFISSDSYTAYSQYVRVTNWYNIKAERQFAIEKNKFAYLGRIEIIIENFDDDPKVTFYLDEKAKQNDMDLLAERMPLLNKAIKGKVMDTKMKMLYIDKTYNIGEAFRSNRPWIYETYTNCSFEYYQGKHTIKSFTESCPYDFVKLNYYNIPVNYNISFTSKWKEGVTTERYGLILGENIENLYFFNATGQGTVGVWYKNNGENVVNFIGPKNNMVNVCKENMYIIKVRGNHVEYYANDNLVGEFDIGIDTPDWKIGFQICDKQNIVFSNLVVEEVD